MRRFLLGVGLVALAGPALAQSAPSTEPYDARVRQSAAAAQAFRGPLDGGWIASARGRDLLQLQLVDKGAGQVEGAWRDLLGGTGLNASGLLDATPVTNGAFDARFGPWARGRVAYELDVRPAADGRLAGTFRHDGEVLDVDLRRAP